MGDEINLVPKMKKFAFNCKLKLRILQSVRLHDTNMEKHGQNDIMFQKRA